MGLGDTFRGLDFARIDSLFTEEERMIRDSVREWVTGEVLPVIEHHFREGTFPEHLIPAIGSMGLLGANLHGYGCAGLGAVAYGLIMQELERGDSGLRSFVSVQGGLVMYPIHAFGSEAQKSRWLPILAKGDAIGCFGLTEPDHGSDPGSMVTRAVRKRDRWVINGAKAWITNGSVADVSVVWAQTENGIRGFLVEKGTPGFTTKDHTGKFSLRASVTSELILQDVELGEDALLPGSDGLKSPLMCLTQARYGIAWGVIGLAQCVFDEALQYSKQRIMFGKPVAGFQLTQRKLAWMATEITKSQLLNLHLGRLKEAGTITPQQVSMGKMNGCRVARECTHFAREILGANGVADEYQTGRHFCNIEAVYTYEGTDDIHTLIVGQELTGLPAFS
ncbi:MAG TPA: acyl-CoA dehydrogenase family protein [Candidatus Sulfotelmatobacter sp.]|jgi:glutaryl-CoA dehydrogenase|nr:acyl-CoA dehydrogenase family protein [Candidatus Sulfotelmatobacter sp.]